MAKVVEDSLMDRVRVDPVTLCMGTSRYVQHGITEDRCNPFYVAQGACSQREGHLREGETGVE